MGVRCYVIRCILQIILKTYTTITLISSARAKGEIYRTLLAEGICVERIIRIYD